MDEAKTKAVMDGYSTYEAWAQRHLRGHKKGDTTHEALFDGIEDEPAAPEDKSEDES